jgi:2-polyprenyl-3-methyl-5-hydroxy-6-metoxy-1,4-benzoquinol methylase
MIDHFSDKAAAWDTLPVPQQISEGVFRALIAAVDVGADDVVLDFGAGTGLLTGKIAPRVKRVLAVDVSQAMLAQLAQKPELQGKVEVHCQNLFDTPLGAQADVVVSAMAMHHVDDTAALTRALFAHTKPGGRVALADLDSEDGTFHPQGAVGVFHAGFDRAAFGAALAAAGFVDVGFVTACTVTKEGRAYPIFLATAARPA